MDLAAVTAKVQELNRKIKQLKEETTEAAKQLFSEGAAAMFEQAPEIESVFWTQYTPYFNDGYTCYFGVGDVYFTLKGEECEECDEGYYFYTKQDLDNAIARLERVKEYNADPVAWKEKQAAEYSIRVSQVIRPYPSSVTEAEQRVLEIKEQMSKFSEQDVARITDAFESLCTAMLHIPESSYESLFGDHVKVIITRQGTEVEEYYHD